MSQCVVCCEKSVADVNVESLKDLVPHFPKAKIPLCEPCAEQLDLEYFNFLKRQILTPARATANAGRQGV